VAAQVARAKVPASLPMSYFPRDGGLLSYVPRYSEMFRLAAAYVVRILNGERLNDLPIQVPTKY